MQDIVRGWDILDKPDPGPAWEFMWNALVDEGREKNLLKHPLTVHASISRFILDASPEDVHLAESVVKVCIPLYHKVNVTKAES